MRHDSYNYFVQTIKLRSMHHARSFFIAYFNSLPPLKSKQKATTARCEHLLARLEKGTKARCLDVSGNCFGEKYYKFFCELLILTFMHICAYGQMSPRGNHEATLLYKDVVLKTVPFGAVEFFQTIPMSQYR